MKKKILELSFAFILLFLSSCVTTADSLSQDLSSQELIQRAQNASSNNNLRNAEFIYNEVLNRFPLDNEAVCNAKYEIAFIHYKQRKWDISRSEFSDILDRYKKNDAALLPSKFKVLAQIVIDKIDVIKAPKKGSKQKSDLD
ncbi:MAG: hypothetical protein Ta2G_07960 [Termitinemataceae bacterium]|nr:MAG: hypothetical protein Ta2G_07960 [Termitinemataceae bacterium]